MKRCFIGALALAAAASLAAAADLKSPDKVDVAALTKECQRNTTDAQANGEKGFNFIWYMPLEFWQASLLQNPQVTPKQAADMISQMKGVLIVAVVRSQVHAMGQFEFFDQESVHKNLTVQYTGPDGKTITLEEQKDLSPGLTAVLAGVRPVLQAAMGKLGQNMYFFVYNDADDNGKRLAPPDAAGKLTVTLAPLTNEPGGKLDLEFPLNSLFAPRECPTCHHGAMDIHWQFCPYCGGKLPA